MMIPTNIENPTREDLVRGFMDSFGDERREAERAADALIWIGAVRIADVE